MTLAKLRRVGGRLWEVAPWFAGGLLGAAVIAWAAVTFEVPGIGEAPVVARPVRGFNRLLGSALISFGDDPGRREPENSTIRLEIAEGAAPAAEPRPYLTEAESAEVEQALEAFPAAERVSTNKSTRLQEKNTRRHDSLSIANVSIGSMAPSKGGARSGGPSRSTAACARTRRG